MRSITADIVRLHLRPPIGSVFFLYFNCYSALTVLEVKTERVFPPHSQIPGTALLTVLICCDADL